MGSALSFGQIRLSPGTAVSSAGKCVGGRVTTHQKAVHHEFDWSAPQSGRRRLVAFSTEVVGECFTPWWPSQRDDGETVKKSAFAGRHPCPPYPGPRRYPSRCAHLPQLSGLHLSTTAPGHFSKAWRPDLSPPSAACDSGRVVANSGLRGTLRLRTEKGDERHRFVIELPKSGEGFGGRWFDPRGANATGRSQVPRVR